MLLPFDFDREYENTAGSLVKASSLIDKPLSLKEKEE